MILVTIIVTITIITLITNIWITIIIDRLLAARRPLRGREAAGREARRGGRHRLLGHPDGAGGREGRI